MELKEAREIAKRVKTQDLDTCASAVVVSHEMFRVAVTLDDRITELEAQQSKLLMAYEALLKAQDEEEKFLKQIIRQREANLNITEQRNRELEAEMKQVLSEFDEVEKQLKIKQSGIAD